MLFCIVTFNLWLHYSKLLTYLYLLLLCPVCTAFSFFPVLFYNYCCLVRINKWIDGWITKWLQLVADNNFETLGCSWLKNLCKWHCKPWSIDCWSVVTILQQMHSTCIFYNILLLFHRLNFRRQKFAVSLTYFERALDMMQEKYGHDSPQLISVYQSLGRVSLPALNYFYSLNDLDLSISSAQTVAEWPHGCVCRWNLERNLM